MVSVPNGNGGARVLPPPEELDYNVGVLRFQLLPALDEVQAALKERPDLVTKCKGLVRHLDARGRRALGLPVNGH